MQSHSYRHCDGSEQWAQWIGCQLLTQAYQSDGVNLIYRQYLLWKQLMRILSSTSFRSWDSVTWCGPFTSLWLVRRKHTQSSPWSRPLGSFICKYLFVRFNYIEIILIFFISILEWGPLKSALCRSNRTHQTSRSNYIRGLNGRRWCGWYMWMCSLARRK